jgi:mRNA deadenylase 3'-5' endonuclease subunit Ccr4
MHGSFIVCLKEMIITKFDESFWIETLHAAGFEPDFHPISNKEIADDQAVKLVKAAVKRLNMDDRRFGEAFGNYWIKYFAKEKYFAFFSAYRNIRDFINNMTAMHKKLTMNLPNPKPPEFDVIWDNEHSATIIYNSTRGFIHVAVGLLKALGDFYHEDIAVFRTELNRIKIFLKN